MQVILNADVDHLGYADDVVEVKRGYWRNYLRPRGLAQTATSERVRELTDAMERRRSADARSESEAKEIKSLLDRTVLSIPMLAGPQGRLFGSVTAADIARTVEKARRLRLDSRKVRLDEPIKALGTFMVPVEVYAGVTAEIKTMIVEQKASEEEIARLERKEREDAEAVVAAAEADARSAADAARAADAAADTPDAADGDDDAQATADADSAQ